MAVRQSDDGGRVAILMVLALLVPSAEALAGTSASPASLAPPAGNILMLSTHATGTQAYVCLPSAARPGQSSWHFIGPEAALSAAGRAGPSPTIARHLLSQVPGASTTPNPGCVAAASGAAEYCPAWQDVQDQSVVWGEKVAGVAAGSTAACPTAGAIPCLLLKTVVTRGNGLFAGTSYIQRLDTSGGTAPLSSCSSGQLALVPYTATYSFYAASP